MSSQTSIEWTEFSWNPTTGCTKVSPGCQNCYAERMALRLQNIGMKGYEHGFAVTLHPDRLREPIMRKRRTRYFVGSMSDLFHERVPDGFIESVLGVITQTPQHTFLILTKRAWRMAEFFQDRQVPTNAWLGVTAENRGHGLPRIRHLTTIDAPIRFVSMEPLLEDMEHLDLKGITWVIVGGESGPRARPMRPQWVANIKSQCDDQGTEFFFKQWGAWGSDGVRRAKKKNGRLLLGRTWDGCPAVSSPLVQPSGG